MTVTSRLPPHARAVPTSEPSRFTWKRSPVAAGPLGHAFVTVTFGAAFRMFVIVHEAVPPYESVPEQPEPVDEV